MCSALSPGYLSTTLAAPVLSLFYLYSLVTSLGGPFCLCHSAAAAYFWLSIFLSLFPWVFVGARSFSQGFFDPNTECSLPWRGPLYRWVSKSPFCPPLLELLGCLLDFLGPNIFASAFLVTWDFSVSSEIQSGSSFLDFLWFYSLISFSLLLTWHSS